MKAKKKENPYGACALPIAPERLRLRRREDGQYIACWDEHAPLARINRCFPWSDRDHYVSIRDTDDREICLVRDLGQLDPESRAAVERALGESGFLLEIIDIEDIVEEFELRTWRVRTAQGPRNFQTKREAWPLRVANGALVIRDVAGDLFCIPDPEALDQRSRVKLQVYID